jgi:hypothetical protein
MLTIWNPICGKFMKYQIINSFHGMYNQSVYRNCKAVYLVKNINCKCMPYFLVTDKMINCKYNYNLKDIYNDLKIKYPRQLCDIKEPPSICNIKLLK